MRCRGQARPDARSLSVITSLVESDAGQARRGGRGSRQFRADILPRASEDKYFPRPLASRVPAAPPPILTTIQPSVGNDSNLLQTIFAVGFPFDPQILSCPIDHSPFLCNLSKFMFQRLAGEPETVIESCGGATSRTPKIAIIECASTSRCGPIIKVSLTRRWCIRVAYPATRTICPPRRGTSKPCAQTWFPG